MARREAGLSPRGRGKLPACKQVVSNYRSIPAWAGETAKSVNDLVPLMVYPRVGGGNEGVGTLGNNSEGLSPRGRGKHAGGVEQRYIIGSIPAWAGETPRLAPYSRLREVYPRVGGGNWSASL